MQTKALLTITATVFLASGSLEAASKRPVVLLDTGLVGGATAAGVDSFKGIPFAAAPIGQLRWRAPQPTPHWRGVREATHDGNDCQQTPFPGNAAPLGAPLSEDCLYLNVWRPAGANASAHLPVMLWIHGGGFVNGGASAPVFVGDSFAHKGVIMVGINYRVGRFGFFGFPALTKKDADHGLLGNYGYMDQIAALQWVRRNIAAFGGDPANVTIFGESAGGGSVHALITSPLAQGLFARAIVQSGGGRGGLTGDRKLSTDLPGIPSLETVGVAFAKAHDIDGTGEDALAKLRALPAQAIDGGLNMATMGQQAATYGGPAIDGRIVVDAPEHIYRKGGGARVPTMVGANSGDIGFVTGSTKAAVFSTFGTQMQAARMVYDPSGQVPLPQLKSMIGRDRTMVEPARFVAQVRSERGIPTYEFRFSYVANSMAGQWTAAPHATDVPFVMNTVQAKYGQALAPRDANIADQMNSYWANFAKTGNPNGPGLPNWPAYDTAKDVIMDFGSDGEPKAGSDPWKAQLDLIATLNSEENRKR